MTHFSTKKEGCAIPRFIKNLETGKIALPQGVTHEEWFGILAQSLGVTSEFATSLLSQSLSAIGHKGLDNPEVVNNLLEALESMAPQDATQAMIAAQAAALHHWAMKITAGASQRIAPDDQDDQLKLALRLMGMFKQHLAVLRQHRGDREQKTRIKSEEGQSPDM